MILEKAFATFVDLEKFKTLYKCVDFFNLSDLQKVANTFFENAILSWKIVPQGLFGWKQLHFEPEKRPAGAFWAESK